MYFYCSNSKKVSIFAVEIVTDVTVTPVTINYKQLSDNKIQQEENLLCIRSKY